MVDDSPVSPLPHESNRRPPATAVSYESDAEQVRIVFPVFPQWVIYCWAVLYGGMTIVSTWQFVAMMRQMREMTQSFAHLPPGVSITVAIWSVPVEVGIIVAFLWVSCIYSLLRYLRWGQIPTTLEVLGRSWTLTRSGYWGYHRRHWTSDDVRGIRINSIKSLFPGWYAVRLRIRLQSGRVLRFRFTTNDATLGEHMGQSLIARWIATDGISSS